MKKCIFIFVAIIACLSITIWSALLYSPRFIAKTLTSYLKVPVTVEDINYRINGFTIKGFSIANPKSYQLKRAFAAKEIDFTLSYYQLLLPTIHIDKIVVDDVYVGIEFTNNSNTTGNWTDIVNNALSEDKKEKQEDGNHGRIVVIDDLLFNQVDIDLIRYRRNLLKVKPIKKIELHNINTSKGLPMKEITKIIVRQVMKSISITVGIKDMLQSFASTPADVVDFVFKPFSLFFSGGEKQSKEGNSSKELPSNRGPS